jgi:hypothetical protein
MKTKKDKRLVKLQKFSWYDELLDENKTVIGEMEGKDSMFFYVKIKNNIVIPISRIEESLKIETYE